MGQNVLPMDSLATVNHDHLQQYMVNFNSMIRVMILR